jgi:hypothetical protein
MSTSTPGPGIRWLAERSGRPPDDLLGDRPAVLRALAEAGRDGADLVARLASEDPQVRARAQAEARAVRSWFAAHDDPTGPTPGERFGSRVAEILRDAAQRVRDAPTESGREGPGRSSADRGPG